MAQSQAARSTYIERRESSNELFDVAEGDVDAALPLIEACTSGDDILLRDLLSHPDWAKIMLDTQWCIKSEHRPVKKDVQNDARGVYVGWMENLVRGMNRSAPRGHIDVVKTLLKFGKEHDVEPLDFIRYHSVLRVMYGHHLDIMEVFIEAEPSVVTFHMGHGVQPLDHAVRYCMTDMVALLFRHGATVKHPGHGGYGNKRDGSYMISLLSKAAPARTTRLVELLLEHGAVIPQSGALHAAAGSDRLDTMRLLIQRGADVNEFLPENTLPARNRSLYATWSPMHFAADGKKVDAMKLLEGYGARSDVKDEQGKTPKQLLEERREEERKAEDLKPEEKQNP
ncbi:hypothetical protein M409DRAFT_22466 [Zasmidium cellare ATCC 36951]|uniref:Uncharacterized protein n=1 Tax=Zasmidium cellare ATCC 36951 TaxID=1080233 RepID=A0A6A6CLE7_ZASCE|nr:uncharacterized protein M409DRAFT_22466 [Zasmidium cellare ATCC 36951]KAF2167028.1 hypothetical protein M409DRAFT_22466 [Zasmidium cellare ATCC 36951]